MKIYFDSNVLIAALQPDHIHHVRSFSAYAGVERGSIAGYLCGHGLTEIYSVLTRAPFSVRVSPAEIRTVIEQSIVRCFNIVDVTAKSHLVAIASCANTGWRGGRIHDAMHIQAAVQAGCDLIYTYDTAHFESLAPEWGGRIQSPPAA